MTAFIASFLFIFIAELGDKTQLLVMAFAAKYKIYEVVTAVFCATFLLNLIAVLFGKLLVSIIPLDLIMFLAALSFVFFGVWMLRSENEEGEEKRSFSFGPVLTIALAFFIAETGDKTQLAAISFSVKYNNIFSVLAGSTLGMFIADCAGIVLGAAFLKKYPDKVKFISSIIFIIFGLSGIYSSIAGKYGTSYGVISSIIAVFIVIVSAIMIIKNSEEENESGKNNS